MARDLMNDGHVQLSDSPTVPMPDRFSAPDNGKFVPQAFGHNEDSIPVTDDD